MKKLLAGLGVALVVVVAAAAVYVASRQHLTFSAPLPAVAASNDPAVIERGHYLVYTLANCSICHGDPQQVERSRAGEEVPLLGGFEFNIPPGKFYPRNITPDAETGIGRFSDGEVARALRYGVGHDGHALLPFMEMQGLSDEDLVAVVSFLRSTPPVHNVAPAHQYNVLGMILKATVLANPVGPKETPPTTNPSGATVENGAYLAGSVINCWACHTERNPATGKLVGPRFAGGHMVDDFNSKRTWSAPNLTNDPTSGRLARFTEDEFVARFKLGPVFPGSPMPWSHFKNIREDDVRAVYRYLKSLPPVVRETGAPFVDKP
jgi:mono/diheme cytochrome c family protein